MTVSLLLRMSALVLGGTATIFGAGVETRHARRRNSSLPRAVHTAFSRRALEMRGLYHRAARAPRHRARRPVQSFRRMAALDRDHDRMAGRSRARGWLYLPHPAGDLADGRPLSRRHRESSRAHLLSRR